MSVNYHAYRQQGIALVIVLWMVSLLSVIAAGMSYAFRQESQLAGHYVEQARLQALAEAGIYYGIQQLFDDDEESRWRRDGQQYELSLAGRRVKVSLQDERGKIDLNTASADLLEHIIGQAAEGVDALSVSRAIIDWRDRDQDRQDGGAEDDDYQLQQYAYGARDGAFLSIMELQQVMGISAAVYQDISKLLTIYTGSKGIDPWTVSPQVLARLPGMDETLAAEFVETRNQTMQQNRRVLKQVLPLETQAYIAQSGPAVFTITSSVQSAVGNQYGMYAVVHLTGREDTPYSIVALHHASSSLTLKQAQVHE